MPKEFTFQLDAWGGKRTLHVTHDNLSKEETERVEKLMPKIFERIVNATNHAYARATGYKDAKDLASQVKNGLPYTRLKDWLKIQRKLVASDKVSAWSEESFDFIYGEARKRFRLDNHSDTLKLFERLLGKDHAAFQKECVSKTPNDKAQVFLECILGIISAFNLEHVYVQVDKMGAVGSSGKSYANWRAYHDTWDPKDPNLAFKRDRMEKHLVADYAKKSPIKLNIAYISDKEEGGEYNDVYGQKLTLADHITKTFIHEASHMWCAAEDHYYWRPLKGELRAYASLSCKAGVKSGDLIPQNEVETERSILNADTFGWFLYWWGKA